MDHCSTFLQAQRDKSQERQYAYERASREAKNNPNFEESREERAKSPGLARKNPFNPANVQDARVQQRHYEISQIRVRPNRRLVRIKSNFEYIHEFRIEY